MELSLSEHLKLAIEGGSNEIREFLNKFANSILYVPEKFQPQALKINVTYPNRPFNFYAVADTGQVRIPVFSDESLINNWTTLPLTLRTVKCKSLIELMPEDWWMVLNPADEYSKDFSPWELQRLLGSAEDLEEVVNEILSEQGIQPLQVRALAKDEFPDFRSELQNIFDSNNLITEVYTAVETGENIENKQVETLIAGFRISQIEPDELNKFKDEIRSRLSPYLIGAIDLRILTGVGFSDLELGVFADFSPALNR